MKGTCCAVNGPVMMGFGTDDPEMWLQSVVDGPVMMGFGSNSPEMCVF